MQAHSDPLLQTRRLRTSRVRWLVEPDLRVRLHQTGEADTCTPTRDPVSAAGPEPGMAGPSGRAAKFQSLKQAPVKSRTLYFNAPLQRRPAPDFSRLIIHNLDLGQENNWWRRSSLHIFSAGPVTFCLFRFVNVQKWSPRIIWDSAGHQEQLGDQNFPHRRPK